MAQSEENWPFDLPQAKLNDKWLRRLNPFILTSHIWTRDGKAMEIL